MRAQTHERNNERVLGATYPSLNRSRRVLRWVTMQSAMIRVRSAFLTTPQNWDSELWTDYGFRIDAGLHTVLADDSDRTRT